MDVIRIRRRAEDVTGKGSKKVTMIESKVQRFDAEVTERKVEDALKMKRARTDCEC
jgi:hypothetical protein